jgi:Protein of unknown function (DUF2975)
MTNQHENPLSSRLANPLGQRSLSSSLATALRFAHVLLSVAFAFAVVGAAFGIPFSILVATHVIAAKALQGAGHGDANMFLNNWTIAVPYLAYGVIATRGALLIVRRLQRVFASFVANEPFAPDNAVHLRAIWVTLIVIEIARITAWVLMHALTTVWASDQTVIFPAALDNPIDLVRLFLIFVVLILAEVFRKGTQLSKETELTV